MQRYSEQMQVRVGAFVAVGLFFLFLVIFLLGSEKNLFEDEYKLICHYDDISGLRVGAPVQLAGIGVGRVDQIRFESSLERKKVKLVLSISSRFQDRIREDSVASIVTQGLLGDRLVSISVGSPEKRALEDGDELTTSSPIGFAELMDEGRELLTHAKKTAEDLSEIMGEVRHGNGVLHGLVYNPEGERLVSDMSQVAQNMKSVSSNMEQVSGKIRRGEGTIGALVNDATLFNDMKTLLGKANRNKLIRSVIRYTLQTKEEKLIENK